MKKEDCRLGYYVVLDYEVASMGVSLQTFRGHQFASSSTERLLAASNYHFVSTAVTKAQLGRNMLQIK
jgi:hypothetical protein